MKKFTKKKQHAACICCGEMTSADECTWCGGCDSFSVCESEMRKDGIAYQVLCRDCGGDDSTPVEEKMSIAA